jgi:hypothetical protein
MEFELTNKQTDNTITIEIPDGSQHLLDQFIKDAPPEEHIRLIFLQNLFSWTYQLKYNTQEHQLIDQSQLNKLHNELAELVEQQTGLTEEEIFEDNRSP